MRIDVYWCETDRTNVPSGLQGSPVRSLRNEFHSKGVAQSVSKALEQLKKLNGCQIHTSVMLSDVDIRTMNRLGLQLTSEPRYENKKIYH